MSINKEYMVYCVPISSINVNSTDIAKWHRTPGLTSAAIKFIKEAEKLRSVCSLIEFIDKLNYEEIYLDNYYFFVTDKHYTDQNNYYRSSSFKQN